MTKKPLIILIAGSAHAISVAAERMAQDVSRTAPIGPLIMPGIIIENRKHEIEFPDFDLRPLREKPKRDWEQRLPGKRKRR